MKKNGKRMLIDEINIFYIFLSALIIIFIQFISLTVISNNIRQKLVEMAETTANEMQLILTEPLYNVDESQAVRIGEAVLGSGRVSGIELFSGTSGNILSSHVVRQQSFLNPVYKKILGSVRDKYTGKEYFHTAERAIYHKDIFLGNMILYFDGYSVTELINYQIIISLFIVLAVIFFNFLATNIFLMKKVKQPFAYIINGIKSITAGDYDILITRTAYRDVNILINHINTMAKKIKKNNSELSNEKERLSVTLGSIGDGVITTDIEGLITNINLTGEKITGWPSHEAEGRHLDEVLRLSDPETRSAISIPLNTMEDVYNPSKFEATAMLLSKTGMNNRISVTVSGIINNYKCIGTVIVFKDITKDFIIQEQLRQSQKMDAIGQLAGGIAHDFNNMLAAILGSVELINMDRDYGENTAKYIATIENAAKHSADLISKLLVFSRRGKGKSESFDVMNIVNDAEQILKNTIDKSISVSVNVNTDDTFINGNSSQIQNILINLGINASQAMPDGGELSFNIGKRYLDSDYCELSQFDISEGHYLEIEVRDTGTGIPYEIQKKIFEPFFTTKGQGKGTGLGLSTVYGIVQDHHGAINLYSEPGSGTSFHIYLPLSAKKGSRDFSPENRNLIRGSGVILVVDDEEFIRLTAKAILEKLGYTVLLAENGQEAVKKYIENSGRIDLVLLDMIMPVMNGRETFQALKKIAPECKVVVSSGFSRKKDIDEMEEQGIEGFIQKPFSIYDLSVIIADALGQKDSYQK